eukprot:scaffold3290_cov238-Chaetoceros_neogracile.AAC.2
MEAADLLMYDTGIFSDCESESDYSDAEDELSVAQKAQAVSESLLHEKGEEFKTVEWIKLNERSRVTLQI